MSRCRNLFIWVLFIFPAGNVSSADVDAERELDRAFRLLLQNKPREAVRIIQPLAESGNIQAQVLYGEYFISEENNLAEGRIWLHTAASTGDGYALYRLAMSYLASRSTRDNGEGIKWLIKAAEQGYFEAEEQLAYAYANGRWSLPVDVDQSDYWFQRAGKHKADR